MQIPYDMLRKFLRTDCTFSVWLANYDRYFQPTGSEALGIKRLPSDNEAKTRTVHRPLTNDRLTSFTRHHYEVTLRAFDSTASR